MEFTTLLRHPHWKSMPAETSVLEYLSQPVHAFEGRGSRLKNNLTRYWRGLMEERHPLGIEMAQYYYWLNHYND